MFALVQLASLWHYAELIEEKFSILVKYVQATDFDTSITAGTLSFSLSKTRAVK
jgi:hypothetical protein